MKIEGSIQELELLFQKFELKKKTPVGATTDELINLDGKKLSRLFSEKCQNS